MKVNNPIITSEIIKNYIQNRDLWRGNLRGKYFNILNCKTHVIDSVLSLCKYYNQNFEDGIATLQKNEKWFKKLSYFIGH